MLTNSNSSCEPNLFAGSLFLLSPRALTHRVVLVVLECNTENCKDIYCLSRSSLLVYFKPVKVRNLLRVSASADLHSLCHIDRSNIDYEVSFRMMENFFYRFSNSLLLFSASSKPNGLIFHSTSCCGPSKGTQFSRHVEASWLMFCLQETLTLQGI